MRPIQELKKELCEKVPLGIDVALEALRASIPADVAKYRDVLEMEGSYRDLNQRYLRGLLSDEDFFLQRNKLQEAILDFIDHLVVEDFSQKPAEQAQSKIKKGKVLYRIPDQMQVQQEVECIVRLAFDEVTLMQGLEQMADDAVRDVRRIAKVMSAQLLDPNKQMAFEVRTFSDEVQTVDEADYTEWLYYVTPLLEGTHPLMLKICIIEIIDGIERKKEEVFREAIQVTTQAPEQNRAVDFKPTNYEVELAGETSGRTVVAPPQVMPAPSPNVPTSNIPVPRLPNPIRKIGSALAALLVFGVAMALWFTNTIQNTESNPDPATSVEEANRRRSNWRRLKNAKDSIQLQQFIENDSISEYADSARMELESLRFRIDSIQQGDSIIFITNGGNSPLHLTLLRNDTMIVEQDFNNTNRLYLDQTAVVLPAGTYQVVLHEKNGAECSATLAIAPKTEAIKITAPLPDTSTAEKTVIVPKPKAKKRTKPVRPKTQSSKPPTQPSKPTQPKPQPLPEPKFEPQPVSEPVYNFVSVARSPLHKDCYTRRFQRATGEQLKKEVENARSCTKKEIEGLLQRKLASASEVRNLSESKKVLVSFEISDDGKIKVESIGEELGVNFKEKVKQVLESMRFIPGQNALGAPVNVRHTMSILFKSQ